MPDYFDSTYAGAYKSGSALGEGLGTVAKEAAGVLKQQQAYNTLKAAGMIKEKITPPSDEELKSGLEEAAKKNGIHQLSFTESDDPTENRKGLENAYKSLGIPLPTGKKSVEYNLAPGTEYKVNDNLTMKSPKTFLSQFGLDGNVPDGMEVTGYDQKGQPMIRKIKRDVQGEKFDVEQDANKKAQTEKSQFVLDSANDTLNTIGEVEKGINNFGLTGNVPSIPGSDRKNWEVNVNKLLSGKIIDVMQKMKDASKTGATGFGQLSNKELSVLREASTALKKDLSKEDAQRYLGQMKTAVQKIVDSKSGGSSAQETTGEDPEYQKYLQTIGQ